MKIEPCPYCRSTDCYEAIITTKIHEYEFIVPFGNSRVICASCGLIGPGTPFELEEDPISRWNWLSKAVGERDYYREKVIQFEIEHKDCNK